MEVAWGWEIALALFFGGLGGGAFIIAVVTSILTSERYKEIIKFGNYIGVVSAILCIIFFALDAGRPERAMFLYSNLPTSMISVGTTILSTIIPLGIIYVSYHPPEALPFAEIIKKWFFWTRSIKLRRLIEIILFFIACGLVGYTSFVLGVIRAKPFWHTPLLVLVFFSSGISTGLMAIGFLSSFLYPIVKEGAPKKIIIEILHKLDTADAYMLTIELGAIISYVFGTYYGIPIVAPRNPAATASAAALLYGELSLIFWLLVITIGLIIPLMGCILLAWMGRTIRFVKWYPIVIAILALCVLIGGIFMRYSIVIAGQLI
ncbi:MAG: NrfD/PsrC family molybdoenzyme membrane anchor subunit [Candidatus Methanomethylicia archaeon]